jgi:dienelactone hydrolase
MSQIGITLILAAVAAATPSPAPCTPATAFVGTICAPVTAGKHPAIVLLAGSGGGDTMQATAARFAGFGYVAVSVAYFNAPGLPKALTEIPVETVGKALDDLAKRPDVDANRIGIMGVSKGGEFALLAASTYPVIHAVVADVPSPFAWEGIAQQSMPSASSWSLAGQAVPYVPYASSMAEQFSDAFTNHQPLDLRKGYDAAMAAHKDAIPQAMFHLEKIDGPVLFLGADDDQIWDSDAQSQIGMTYLKEHNHPYADAYVHYPSAGHMFLFATPQNPLLSAPAGPGMTLLVGGTADGNLAAGAKGWEAIARFFASALRP